MLHKYVMKCSKFLLMSKSHLKLSRNLSQVKQLQVESNTLSSKEQSNSILLNNSTWGNNLEISTHWLRDSCQCSSCRDPQTNLRKSDIQLVSSFIPKSYKTSDDALSVIWSDGHISEYSRDWMQNMFNKPSSEGLTIKKHLWDSEAAKTIPFVNVDFEDLMTNDATVCLFLHSITKYGIAVVNCVPVTSDGTRLAMERFGSIWKTFWGEVYFVVADLSQFAHPSYTGVDLKFHTDTNYYYEGAGLQAFHVLEHIGEGGINKFVDGFLVAQKLRKNHPVVYNFLSNNPVSFKYREKDKRHIVNEDCLIKHHPNTGEIEQIRFTEYDFDIFRTISSSQTEEFYHSLKCLRQEINNPDNILYKKLSPGMLLVTDNWRILHGRTSFTGKRTLCGMYVSRSDYLSKMRLFGFST